MTRTNAKLTPAVETCAPVECTHRAARCSSRRFGQLADQGAGRPDVGLYAAKQVQKGRPREGQTPERGVVEVQSADDDAWLTSQIDQVSRYWGCYGLVLVMNARDCVLMGAGLGEYLGLALSHLAVYPSPRLSGRRNRRCGDRSWTSQATGGMVERRSSLLAERQSRVDRRATSPCYVWAKKTTRLSTCVLL